MVKSNVFGDRRLLFNKVRELGSGCHATIKCPFDGLLYPFLGSNWLLFLFCFFRQELSVIG